MNKKALLAKILNKRVKDYSFAISFFLIFSFFVFFAIRPSLSTIFSLRKELADLRKIDSNYEKGIITVITVQSDIEKYRGDFYLLDEAVPSQLAATKVVEDLRRSASETGMIIKKINFSELPLKEKQKKKELKSYIVVIDTDDNFVNVKKFIEDILIQRRLKTIKSLTIGRDVKESSASGVLKIKIELDSYYL